MQNIKILETSTFLETPIPTECIPRRFAIATNVLLCTKNEGLLLFNYEPQKWNQWYPYFSSVNDMYDFKGKIYKDIVDVFYNDIMQREDAKKRIFKAKNEFLELLGVSKGFVKLGDSPIKPEMWLKYSKTQKIWTFYYMEFLQVEDISRIDFESLDRDVIDFMPLTEENVNIVAESGQYRGIDVVDNTLDIIKNKEILSKLSNSLLSL